MSGGRAEADPVRTLRLLIAAKAAPHPADGCGGSGCVIGRDVHAGAPGWVRLCPVEVGALEADGPFRCYDVVELDAVPARRDHRRESWRPLPGTVRRLGHVRDWAGRQRWLQGSAETSMCRLAAQGRSRGAVVSLALLRPRRVLGLTIAAHPARGTDGSAPRFRGWYHYLCAEASCAGHWQSVLDWEFVALQRQLAHLGDAAAVRRLHAEFLGALSGGAGAGLWVGARAGRPDAFDVLGVLRAA
jgi:hypothetical protein